MQIRLSRKTIGYSSLISYCIHYIKIEFIISPKRELHREVRSLPDKNRALLTKYDLIEEEVERTCSTVY